MSGNHKKVFFLHIEKAGGTTMHYILHQSLSGYISPSPKYGKVLRSEDLKKISSLYPITLQGVGGHRLSLIEEYTDNVFYFTFLRDPVERYMSHLNYQLHRMKIPWKIDSFLNESYFNNFQTFRISPNRKLTNAKYQIKNKIQFTGLLEFFHESLILLKQKINFLPLDIRYSRKNKRQEQTDLIEFNDLSPQDQNKVMENNSDDIELYNYVKDEIFPKYMDLYGETAMSRDLEAFKKENFSYNFSMKTSLKRKVSNFYISRCIQPLIQKSVKKGY